MKLTSLRDMDRVHIVDLLRVGMIDETIRLQLAEYLRKRLKVIRTTMNDD